MKSSPRKKKPKGKTGTRFVVSSTLRNPLLEAYAATHNWNGVSSAHKTSLIPNYNKFITKM